MAPCPSLAETSKESERPGVEGKVAGRGLSRPDPRAFCLAGALLSSWQAPGNKVTWLGGHTRAAQGGMGPDSSPQPGPSLGGSAATPKHPKSAGWAPPAVPGSQARIEEHLWAAFISAPRLHGCRRSCSDERKDE